MRGIKYRPYMNRPRRWIDALATDDTFPLQKAVGLLSAGFSLLIAVLNLVMLAQNNTFLESLWAAATLGILGLAAFFALTAFWDNAFFRMVQVATYYLAGTWTFIGSLTGDATGFMFTIFALLLYLEYAKHTRYRTLGALFMALLSVALKLLLSEVPPSLVWFAGALTTAFFLGIVVLYEVVSYRQVKIREMHAERLQDLVDQRTADLREQSERAVKLADERKVLIKEIQHRANNSMMMAISLAEEISDENHDTPILKMRAVSTAYSIVATGGEALNQVAFEPYLVSLVDQVNSVSAERPVATQLDLSEDLRLATSIETMTNLGIAIVETLTTIANQLPLEASTLSLSAELTDSALLLTIRHPESDGLEGFEGPSGFLIDLLKERLNLTIERSQSEPARWDLNIPRDSLSA